MRAPLYLVEQGSQLTREGRRLLVSKGEETLARVALIQVSQVIVFGNVGISTPALKLLLDEGVEVVFLSIYGKFYGRLVGESSGNGSLRVAQVLRSQEPDFALALARHFVRGKLHNLRVFLQRYARREGDSQVAAAVDGIGRMIERIPHCGTINSLSGVEGQASAIYFGAFKRLLHPPWRFEKRMRRPPPDPVNALLSFAYTILGQNVLGAVWAVGLDPYVGFLHQLSYNRPSLSLDLMEPFRPIIADSVVLRCLNNEILKPDHFQPGDDPDRPVLLGEEGVRIFVRELEHRLTQEFKEPESNERVNYRRLFLLQAYALARAINEGDPDEYRPFLVR